ncbi:MAG: DNA primase [Planctomycetes bacterium]|nr:DNA primase [Planctomycetota bacterium]
MNNPIELHADADDQQLLAQIVDYYHHSLKASEEALEYLRNRGISNAQVIDQFRIGFADRTLGLKLPSKQVKAGKAIRGRLEKLGLFRESGHEHFTGSVVFPITAADGTRQIVDMYGRKILGTKLRKGTPIHTYLASERHGVWNIEAFGATEEIILCPSLFDALTFWNHGYRNVTCLFGKDALTADHLAAFAEFQIKRILTPCEGVWPRLVESGLDCYLLRFPSGMDANDYARRSEDAGQTLGAILRHAEWIGKGAARACPIMAPGAVDEPAPMDDEPEEELDDEAFDALMDDDRAPGQAPPELEDDAPEPAPGQPPPETPALIASPLPPAPLEIAAEVKDDEVVMTFGDRRYRVRGWHKNLSFDQLRVNIMAANACGMFVDSLDIYSAKHRKTFIAQTAADLAVDENTIKKDLGRLLLKLEELQDNHMDDQTTPKETAPLMTEPEKQAALELLRDGRLVERIVADFPVVGENTNKIVGYLAAVSRKLDQPLAIIIQSSSAAGKTALMESVLSFVPPEDQVKYSAMTGQSLFYMGESNLKHKILAIVEEEGAQKTSYALKLLQSEGELMIASTGKDGSSGRLVTQEYRVEGPVMIFLTTTAIKIDEELLNRCLVLTVDEDRDQTKAIHRLQRQRQTLQGLLSAQDHQQTLTLHRNAQRLLRPILVANPFAEHLTFLDDRTRTRRDHVKYLTLIRAVTLLHQYQRPVKTVDHQGKQVEYIEVTLNDIEIANRLANEVLGRAVDDLPPQTRRLLHILDDLVSEACQRQGMDRADYRFSRREVREHAGWGNTQLKVHLKRLEELEYLLLHRGGRGQSIVYELLYENRADDGQRFLARLIDVDKLRCNQAGQNGHTSAQSRGQVGVKSGGSRPSKNGDNPAKPQAEPSFAQEVNQNAHLDPEK